MDCWGSSCRSTPSGWEERCGDAGDELPQQVDENGEWVKVALATGTEQRGQDLLRVRPEPRAIPARDFPIDDGRAEGLFRAPGRGVDRRVVQETEERGPLAVEMCDEAAGILGVLCSLCVLCLCGVSTSAPHRSTDPSAPTIRCRS